MKKILLISLLNICFMANAADDWVKKTPSGQLPLARFGHGLAYIGDDKVLCFGGNGGYPGPYANDTWVYDLSENIWTNLDPLSPPSVRRDIAISYIGQDRVILFGGYYPDILGDTWLYTLSTNTWLQLSPPNSPSERYSNELCYIGDDKVLLHGGVGGGPSGSMYLDDLWIFDLSENTWTELIQSGKPSPRHFHEMCLINEENVLLFGGRDTAATRNDTWLYNIASNSWSELIPTGEIPTQRYKHAMVPIGDNKVMLFSGNGFQSGMYGDTWIFNLNSNSWLKDVNTINPFRLESHELAETSLDGTRYVVLFAGAGDSGENNETWTFGGGDYITDIESGTLDLPYEFELEQNYPNPFNPSTIIQYQVSSFTQVTLKVYDILGNEVATLVNEEKPAGKYDVEFSPSSLPNRQAGIKHHPSSGIYFCRLSVVPKAQRDLVLKDGQTENYSKTIKMMYLK